MGRLDAGSIPLQERIAALTEALVNAGRSSAEAARQAYGVIYAQLEQQAQTLAYLDVLFLLACFTAAMVPLVFLTRRSQPGRSAPAH